MTRDIIIIADGKKSNIDSIFQYLTENGYEVQVVYDGIDGFNLARTKRPDLVLIEEVLSGTDGYQICSLLKYDIKYEDITVVILAYGARGKERQMAEICGADNILSFPVDLNKLMGIVTSIGVKEE
jgi:DNA-binding response OmpR family regulator